MNSMRSERGQDLAFQSEFRVLKMMCKVKHFPG